MDTKATHIAVIPTPGAGHLIPLAEFARRLIHHNPSLFFTFILIPSSAAEAESPTTPSTLTATLPSTAFHVIHLPLPSFPAFTIISDEIYSRVLQSINNSLDLLRRTLLEMTRVSALIVDIFATEIISVGAEIGIKSYLFFSSSAMVLSVTLCLHETTSLFSDNEWFPEKPLEFPGCPVIRVKDLPDPVLDRSKVFCKWFIDHCERFKSADAIVLNTFHALEAGPIRALTVEKPVYVVGPLVRDDVDERDSSGCMRWLDEQPPGSVLYVSFGSGGTLTTDQVTELAWGLELSHQRFIWVVRSPNDSVPYGTYLTLDEKTDPLGFLPIGFVERTKGRGRVVPSWAPQVEILGHVSTGGFMTHCGWNSILEGVVSGVGLIAWPLYAEQGMNAIEVVEMVKVGVGVEKDEDGVVKRDVVVKVVKELMEGEQGKKIKERMRLLRDEAKITMGQDGMSNVTLSKLAYMFDN